MKLKLERVKRKWSQEELSKKANVCRSVISRIENGQIDNVQLGILKKLATALETTVEKLFLRDEE